MPIEEVSAFTYGQEVQLFQADKDSVNRSSSVGKLLQTGLFQVTCQKMKLSAKILFAVLFVGLFSISHIENVEAKTVSSKTKKTKSKESGKKESGKKTKEKEKAKPEGASAKEVVPAKSSVSPEKTAEESTSPAVSKLKKKNAIPSKYKPAQQFNFPPTKNGVQVSFPEFVYDLKTNANVLSMGGYELSSSSLGFDFGNFVQFDEKLAIALGQSNTPVILFKWPKELLRFGEIEMIDRSGDVLWSQSIDNEDVEKWQDQLYGFAEKYNEGEKNRKAAKTLFWSSRFGVIDVNLDDALGSKPKTIIKFCIKQSIENYFSRICSSNYQAIVKDGHLKDLKPAKSEQEARILIKNENVALNGAITVKPNETFEFLADLANGITYEFQARPNLVNMIDFVNDIPNNQILIRGKSEPPIDSFVFNQVDRRAFLYKVDWLPTIGDFGPYWEKGITKEDPVLYIPGQGGGIFRQTLTFQNIPEESDRPKFSNKNVTSTYAEDPMVLGSIPRENKLTSKEYQISEHDKAGQFVWDFRAPYANEYNDAVFHIKNKTSEWNAGYTIYRGNPREISGRFTGVLSAASESVLLGELAYNQWFESFFGWRNYYLGQQRWGISVKAFQSLASFKQQNSSEKITFSNVTYDFKYRFTPGIWGRDETWGLVGGSQIVAIQGISAPMMGAGFFWARSFPKLFDDIMNIVPLMRYPKWTDMEFIFYPSSSDSKIQLGTNYALNFHGKIMWSQSVFGELGFGMKAYDFEDTSASKQIIFQSFYGTAGLGINF